MNNFSDDTKIISSESFGDYDLEYLKQKNTLLINVIVSSNNKGHYLSDFLSEFNESDDVKEDLLSPINDVMNAVLLNEVISGECLSAYVENEYTYFINGRKGLDKQKSSENPEMFVSTSIFKEIILKWLEFLESQKC